MKLEEVTIRNTAFLHIKNFEAELDLEREKQNKIAPKQTGQERHQELLP